MQPPASLKALADPIYEAFYGLTEQPFAITTDPRFFYLSGSHQRAYNELLRGLQRREGVLLLTGEIGIGKTTLCRAVTAALGPRTFSAMIFNPYLTAPEVFRTVLRDFGMVSSEELRQGALAGADGPRLLATIEGFLKSLHALDTYAVVVLDEAQSVAPEVLDQLRVLTALEADGQRLVQVVLCGQPELLGMLQTGALRALNERVTRRVSLAPLQADEVEAYIRHRLTVAGGGDAVRFDHGALRLIADLSRGLPRRINVICDRALQEGRMEGVAVIGPGLVKRAARSVAGAFDAEPVPPQPLAAAPPAPAVTTAPQPTGPELAEEEPAPEPKSRLRLLLATAAVLLIAGLGGGYGYYRYANSIAAPGLPTAPAAPPPWAAPHVGPLPVPSESQILEMFPPPAASTPAPSQASPLLQAPDNRN